MFFHPLTARHVISSPGFFDTDCQARNVKSHCFCAQTANPVILRSCMPRIVDAFIFRKHDLPQKFNHTIMFMKAKIVIYFAFYTKYMNKHIKVF